MNAPLHALSATELGAAYRDGRLSPVEVTQAVLDHIARWEPHLQATYLLRPEAALEQARASEARWQRGEALGPLDGVPTTVKENIATRGDPLPAGTAAVTLSPAKADAPPAARLKEAGAVIVSKTTMPDYGMLSSGLSSFHPLARNPWDLRKTPGGSSAGAIVEPMQPFMSQSMLDGMDHLWRTRSFTDLNTLPAAQRAKVLPYIRAWAESAADFSGDHVFRAFSQFHATRVAAVAACARFDYVISPVSPNMPAPAEDPSPTNDPLRPLEHIGFTVPFNMSEQPAASVNCGYSAAGLPIGLQIAGKRFDDLGVLQVSRAFEQIRSPQQTWPLPPAG